MAISSLIPKQYKSKVTLQKLDVSALLRTWGCLCSDSGFLFQVNIQDSSFQLWTLKNWTKGSSLYSIRTGRWNQGFQQWDGPVHMAWKSSYDSILLPVSSSLLLHVEGRKKSIESDWKGMLQPEKKYARVSNFWNGLYIFQHMTPPQVSLFWFIIETNKYTTLSYHDCLTGCKSGLPMGVSGQFCPLCAGVQEVLDENRRSVLYSC